jgi:hypothetical protein
MGHRKGGRGSQWSARTKGSETTQCVATRVMEVGS